jgi:hypothetical protein
LAHDAPTVPDSDEHPVSIVRGADERQSLPDQGWESTPASWRSSAADDESLVLFNKSMIATADPDRPSGAQLAAMPHLLRSWLARRRDTDLMHPNLDLPIVIGCMVVALALLLGWPR